MQKVILSRASTGRELRLWTVGIVVTIEGENGLYRRLIPRAIRRSSDPEPRTIECVYRGATGEVGFHAGFRAE